MQMLRLDSVCFKINKDVSSKVEVQKIRSLLWGLNFDEQENRTILTDTTGLPNKSKVAREGRSYLKF